VDGELVDSRFVDHYLFPFNLLGTPAVARAVDGVVDGLRCPPDHSSAA
jgi:hypothetical protein